VDPLLQVGAQDRAVRRVIQDAVEASHRVPAIGVEEVATSTLSLALRRQK
jgi:hypothetical protein